MTYKAGRVVSLALGVLLAPVFSALAQDAKQDLSKVKDQLRTAMKDATSWAEGREKPADRCTDLARIASTFEFVGDHDAAVEASKKAQDAWTRITDPRDRLEPGLILLSALADTREMDGFRRVLDEYRGLMADQALFPEQEPQTEVKRYMITIRLARIETRADDRDAARESLDRVRELAEHTKQKMLAVAGLVDDVIEYRRLGDLDESDRVLESIYETVLKGQPFEQTILMSFLLRQLVTQNAFEEVPRIIESPKFKAIRSDLILNAASYLDRRDEPKEVELLDKLIELAKNNPFDDQAAPKDERAAMVLRYSKIARDCSLAAALPRFDRPDEAVRTMESAVQDQHFSVIAVEPYCQTALARQRLGRHEQAKLLLKQAPDKLHLTSENPSRRDRRQAG